MITAEQEKYILTSAYIPEHSVELMTCVSGGEPFLIEDHFCCLKDDWLILIGYPLQQNFDLAKFESLIETISKQFNPTYFSLIAPKLPSSIALSCRERESDHYYTLDIGSTKMKSHLLRTVEKAKGQLTIQRSSDMLEAHEELTLEFIERVKPGPRVRELLSRMPHFVGHARNSLLLNAWDKTDNLAAFYVVDLAPKEFSTYVIGCHSKKNYIPGASDLLQATTIEVSREYGKAYIHLGLGVNRGIRQFKKKWGGIATQTYEMCQLVQRKRAVLDSILAAQEILKAR